MQFVGLRDTYLSIAARYVNDIYIPLCGDDSYLIDAQVGKLILNHYRYINVGYLDAIHWTPRHVPDHRHSVCRIHPSAQSLIAQ